MTAARPDDGLAVLASGDSVRGHVGNAKQLLLTMRTISQDERQAFACAIGRLDLALVALDTLAERTKGHPILEETKVILFP